MVSVMESFPVGVFCAARLPLMRQDASRNSWINKKQLLKQADWGDPWSGSDDDVVVVVAVACRSEDSGNPAIPVATLLPVWPADPSYFPTSFRRSAPTLTFPPGSYPRFLVGLSHSWFPERMASKFSYIMQTSFPLTRRLFIFIHSSDYFQCFILHCIA